MITRSAARKERKQVKTDLLLAKVLDEDGQTQGMPTPGNEVKRVTLLRNPI